MISRIEKKKNVGSTSEEPPQMQGRVTPAYMMIKWKHFPRTSTGVQLWRTTHRRGKPIKVIQNCDQSTTDECRWRRTRRREGQNPRRLQHSPALSHANTNSHKKTNVLFSMEINSTTTTSHRDTHSLCSGMNKVLHTWNFLGHRGTPLRELYPFFFLLSVKHR